ncbi:hypothetical protein HFD88_006871 [Aspergillus terreus]|nr:hypothetical protein HFD88_006871 [Aspergillus terreus]
MDKTKYLDFAVRVLSYGFPNSWDERTHQQGHGWESWETCGAILPHVSWLIRLTREHSLQVTDVELFAELIFRAGTYLWEKEQPTMARSFIEYGLSLDIKQSTPNYAQAYRLLGHIGLDMAQPRAALAAYEKALAARETLEEPNSPPIADVYDSIACSYTEQGRVAEAFEYLSKAANIHRAHNSLHMGRTQAIYAMTYLRAGQPSEALTALKSCWELQGLDEEQISQAKYPKHSGDILLLSRIKYAQGLKKEALQLASRTISIRRSLFGDKGPRVADSMFTVARMLEAADGEVLAAKLSRSVVEMSRGVSEMQGHLARSLWFLAAIESRIGDKNQAEVLRVEARMERQAIVGRETTDDDSDDSFMRLVGWMLW